MNIEGSCHCGKISFRADVDPSKVGICHCTDCQILTGSPYRVSVAAASRTFELRQGQPKIYVKTAEDGSKRAQAFCGDCGTPIYASDPGGGETYNIRLGCVKQRAELKPGKRLWARSALPWSLDIHALPSIERD